MRLRMEDQQVLSVRGFKRFGYPLDRLGVHAPQPNRCAHGTRVARLARAAEYERSRGQREVARDSTPPCRLSIELLARCRAGGSQAVTLPIPRLDRRTLGDGRQELKHDFASGPDPLTPSLEETAADKRIDVSRHGLGTLAGIGRGEVRRQS